MAEVTYPEEMRLSAVRAWIADKHGDKAWIDIDLDLIESRVIDSLDFAEFLFFLEELTGKPIELGAVDLDTFRTLRSITARFLAGN